MPEVAMLYQDSDPDLASERHLFERSTILPLLQLSRDSSVVDIGCGVGRWAEPLLPTVASYVGTDASVELIEIARERFSEDRKTTFLHLDSTQSNRATLRQQFDVGIFAGVAHYLNDEDLLVTFGNLFELCPRGLVYFRAPVALDRRLTLRNEWSTELAHDYNAIYRTADELEAVARAAIGAGSLELSACGTPYPPKLGNRVETAQQYWVWRVSL